MPETHHSESNTFQSQTFFRVAATYALLGVVLGAIGAHPIKEQLNAIGTRDTWETAVDYQFWHALAILLWLIFHKNQRAVSTLTPLCFSIGILLFSGSLYILALGGPSWLGPITPLGGLAFMVGWSHWLYKGIHSQTSSNQ
jgi:uncharacterized membrane protein YgdD (TMEM256/DUF423 family)